MYTHNVPPQVVGTREHQTESGQQATARNRQEREPQVSQSRKAWLESLVKQRPPSASADLHCGHVVSPSYGTADGAKAAGADAPWESSVCESNDAADMLLTARRTKQQVSQQQRTLAHASTARHAPDKCSSSSSHRYGGRDGVSTVLWKPVVNRWCCSRSSPTRCLHWPSCCTCGSTCCFSALPAFSAGTTARAAGGAFCLCRICASVCRCDVWRGGCSICL